jgi:uncharacterized protein YdhG (YjbR/CyaY superfamily)
MKNTRIPADIDEYIANCPVPFQKKLKELREAIKKAAPEAEEKISYRMPAFTLKGILVYFAAHTNHIGFYATSSVAEVFKKELAGYASGKGSLHFAADKPLPLDLITKIVIFRKEENLIRAELREEKKKKK